MEIRLLRYFLSVAREENITRAAESLHISQPSLSKQLMELEAELGKKLFVRGKRKVMLTEEGILLRKRAEEIISLVEKTEQEIISDSAAPSGKISIGGLPNKIILRAAAQTRSEYPDISFVFYNGDASEVAERLDHGSIDFAVLLEPVDTVKYEYLSLGNSADWGLLMPRDCPLAEKEAVEKEDFRGIKLVIHKRIGLQREISHWAQMDIEQMNIAATYNVIGGDPADFVLSGLGYLLTTDDHLPEHLHSGLCFRPLNPPMKIHCALVRKRYAVLSMAAEAYLKSLTRVIEELRKS